MHRATAVSAGFLILVAAGCSSTKVISGPQPDPAVTTPARCTTDQLTLTVTGQADHGSANASIAYAAKDGVTCSLIGYPTVVLGTSAGMDQGQELPSTVSGVSPSVTLSGGQGATSSVSWATEPPAGSATCGTLTTISVTAPDATSSLTPTVPSGLAGAKVCGTVEVNPVIRPAQ